MAKKKEIDKDEVFEDDFIEDIDLMEETGEVEVIQPEVDEPLLTNEDDATESAELTFNLEELGLRETTHVLKTSTKWHKLTRKNEAVFTEFVLGLHDEYPKLASFAFSKDLFDYLQGRVSSDYLEATNITVDNTLENHTIVIS